MQAFEDGDMDGVVALLSDDPVWSMPPTPVWCRGRDEVVTFLAAGPGRVRWRRLATSANGQPAVAGYVWDEGRGSYAAFVIDVLSFRDGRIAEITAFLDSSLFERFGLPAELPL